MVSVMTSCQHLFQEQLLKKFALRKLEIRKAVVGHTAAMIEIDVGMKYGQTVSIDATELIVLSGDHHQFTTERLTSPGASDGWSDLSEKITFCLSVQSDRLLRRAHRRRAAQPKKLYMGTS